MISESNKNTATGVDKIEINLPAVRLTIISYIKYL